MKIRNWTATASGDILDESGAVIFHRAPLGESRSYIEAKEDAQFVVMAVRQHSRIDAVIERHDAIMSELESIKNAKH